MFSNICYITRHHRIFCKQQRWRNWYRMQKFLSSLLSTFLSSLELPYWSKGPVKVNCYTLWKKYIMIYAESHWITEPLRLEKTFKITKFNSYPNTAKSTPKPSPECPIYTTFNYLQEWRSHCFPRQSISVFDNTFMKKFFLVSKLNLL